jgi:hypothetical protein
MLRGRSPDRAGCLAAAVLGERARALDVEPLTLPPNLGDFNDDLRQLSADLPWR